MKKIVFGSISAILAVISFSAFRSAKPTTTYYWFTYSRLAENPTFGDVIITGAFFTGTFPADIETAEPSITCTSDSFYCKFGFTANQVNFTALGNHILSIRASQVPKTKLGKP